MRPIFSIQGAFRSRTESPDELRCGRLTRMGAEPFPFRGRILFRCGAQAPLGNGWDKCPLSPLFSLQFLRLRKGRWELLLRFESVIQSWVHGALNNIFDSVVDRLMPRSGFLHQRASTHLAFDAKDELIGYARGERASIAGKR